MTETACPQWCVTDHDRFSFHGSGPVTVEAPQHRTCHVRAVQYAAGGGPLVQVAADGTIRVPADDAGDLAAVIEQLAGATPEQHRELAAAIRKAAAQVTEGSNG
jgi:hypothetical protein